MKAIRKLKHNRHSRDIQYPHGQKNTAEAQQCQINIDHCLLLSQIITQRV